MTTSSTTSNIWRGALINHSLQLLHPDMARSPIVNMVSIIAATGTTLNSRSNTSDRVVGDIQYIPPSA
eukprot:408926-Pleurochrysis_carterae.AAC.1